LCFSGFQSVFFGAIKQICYRIIVRTRRIEQGVYGWQQVKRKKALEENGLAPQPLIQGG
jgi:hypothetical protein